MNRMLDFYRTTEGIIVAMSAYVVVAVGLAMVWSVAVAGPAALMAPLAVFALVFGGAGLYMFADAVQRVVEAVAERYGKFLNEVMNA